MKNWPDVRPSPIAGKWYAADPLRLADQVDQFLDSAQLPQIDGEIVAVMAPHAGHLYSGPVAGYAFAALRGIQADIVAILSPMHHPYYEPLLTSAHSAYATPLGPIEVNQQALEDLDHLLEDRLGFGLSPVKRDPEHSLEIELPFLQRAIHGDFTLLPIMVRDQAENIASALGEALAKLLDGRKALLVASTDLSHFFPQAVAEELDAEFLSQVETFEPRNVLRAEEEGRGFACGRAPLAAVMWAAKGLGADQAIILKHATSGEVTGELNQVVGYASAVFLRSKNV